LHKGRSRLRIKRPPVVEESGKLPEKVKRIDVHLSHKVSDGEFNLKLEEQSAGTISFLEFCGFFCCETNTKLFSTIEVFVASLYTCLILSPVAKLQQPIQE